MGASPMLLGDKKNGTQESLDLSGELAGQAWLKEKPSVRAQQANAMGVVATKGGATVAATAHNADGLSDICTYILDIFGGQD